MCCPQMPPIVVLSTVQLVTNTAFICAGLMSTWIRHFFKALLITAATEHKTDFKYTRQT